MRDHSIMTHGRRLYFNLTALFSVLVLAGSAACASRAGGAPAAPAAGAAPAAPAAGPATTAAGAFTGGQAMRGQTGYSQACSVCHLEDLSGSDQAPPLAGDGFMANWLGQDVGALVDRVRTTMPLDNPGSLSSSAATDIVAYMLQANNMPAGSQELTSQSIRTITIQR
jgi:cytochrome c553